MGGETHELTLQLVDALERLTSRALLREQPRAIEREAHQRPQRREELAFLRAEERREGARPDDQRPERKLQPSHVAGRRLVHRAVLGDSRSVDRIERDAARADHAGHRRQHSFGDVLLIRRRHQLTDRELHLPLLGPPPEESEPVGRRETEHERDRAQRGDKPRHEREHRVVVAARRGEHEGGGDRSRSDREHLHPPARDGCLRTARAPQAHRHDQQQHRPVNDEDDDVRGEPPRPRVVPPRQVRQDKGCGDQSGGERIDERGERALRRLERHREAIEEIREEHQEREVQPLERILGEALRLVRQQLADDDHRRERHERERSPERCRRSFRTPLPNANDCDRCEQHEVEDPDELDRLSHFAFLLGALILLRAQECDNGAPSPAVSCQSAAAARA